MISESSKNSQKAPSNVTTGWKTCPECGTTYDIVHTYCKNCHYFSLEWQKPGDKDTAETSGKKRLKLLVLVVSFLILAYLVWDGRDYIPNPLVLLDKPVSTYQSQPGEGEWTNFGHDPAQSRYVAKGRAVVGQIVWSINPGQYTASAPAIKGKTLYLGGHFQVKAINAETGDIIWEKTTTGPVKSSPAIAGQLVYFTLLDGRVLALDCLTGKNVWEFTTGSHIFGSPTVVDGILYIGSGDSKIYALDAATGRKIWTYMTKGPIPFSPAVKDGIIYIASKDKTIYSLNAKSGTFRLRFRNYWSFIQSPVIGNELVYFTSVRGHLDAFNYGAREFPGQYRMRQIWGQFWLWGFGVPFPPQQPGAAWRISPQNKGDQFVSSPAIAPDSFYLGDTSGRFYGRDASSGKSGWSFKAAKAISSLPLVLGNRVIFGSGDGSLFALNRHSGELHWKLTLAAPILIGPVYGAGRIFVRTTDGWLHAIE